jgi:hypothetical protein
VGGTGTEIEVAGERLVLRPDRTLHWPADNLLLVADLHWGKTETFQRFGLGVPNGVLTDDLARLASAVRATGARQVWVLGDLVHGALGLTPAVVAEVAAFLAATHAELRLVLGNHDQHLEALPATWAIPVCETAQIGPFVFQHEPEPSHAGYVWAGHLHPAVRVQGRGRRDAVRLPCFAVGERVGVLPAFSAFTGGAAVRDPTARCYAIAGEAVVAVPPPKVRGRG